MGLKFSVITINYNNSTGLQLTIESVINQDCTNFEYIVIDGGSTDSSTTIIDNYKDKISFYLSEKDNGVYNAMNKGLQHAKGEYCIFMNSGDIFASSTVLTTVSLFMDSDADIVYGCHLWDNCNGARWNPKKDFHIRDIFGYTPISHQATFIKKDLLNRIGGFKEKYKIIADWGVLIDSMRLNVKMQKICLDICIAEIAGESNVSNERILEERVDFLKENHLVFYLYSIYLVNPFRNLLKKIK